jgi:hypothetical protein
MSGVFDKSGRIRVAKESIGVAAAVCVIVVFRSTLSSVCFRYEVLVGLEVPRWPLTTLRCEVRNVRRSSIAVARARDRTVRLCVSTAISMRKRNWPGRVAQNCNWRLKTGGFRVSLLLRRCERCRGWRRSQSLYVVCTQDGLSVFSGTERWKAKR